MLYKYTYTCYKSGSPSFLGSEEQWQNYIAKTGGVYENVTKEAVTDLHHIGEHVKTMSSPCDNPLEKGITLAIQ